MRPADEADRQATEDPHATRAPSPGTFEAMHPSERTIASYEAPSAPSIAIVGVSLVEFERGLVDQGLMDPEALREFLRGLPVVDAEGLARALVREGRLTRYQAAAIFQGKARSLMIGPYLLLDKLGSGGMGMVFKARRRPDGPEVALKLLPPSASRKPQAVQRFRREAEVMARLDHPNIVAAHEIGEYGGVHYLVMDFVEGRDLDRVVRSGGPLKPGRAVSFLIQAARGLRAAHERGIVHRDIKPANLLLDDKGVVRVLDLGLARIALDEESGSGPSLTQSGMIMGTVDYLPPEQSDDSKRADHRADIYSLACSLHFLLTGRPPFSGDSVMQRLLAHHQRPAPSLREGRPEVPAALDALFGLMMAKAPEDRPQSMAEVIVELESIRAAPASSRGLLVFDDGQGASGLTRGPGDSAMDREVPPANAELSGYDLMTFVRSELLDTDETEVDAAARLSDARLQRRRSRASRRRWAIGVALVVGALALSTLGVIVGVVASQSFGVGFRAVPVAREVRDESKGPPRPPVPLVDEHRAAEPTALATEPPPTPPTVPDPTGSADIPGERTPPPVGPGIVDLLRPLLKLQPPPPPPPPGGMRPPRPGDPQFGPVPGSRRDVGPTNRPRPPAR